MNILVLSDGFPTESHKMSGLFAFDQAKALKDAGHNVVFGCINLRSLRHKNFPGKQILKKNGITIYSIHFPLGQVPVAVKNVVSCYLFKKLFQDIVKDGYQIDIVHAHFYDMAYCAAVNKAVYGYKLVVTEHYSGYVNGSELTQRKLKKNYQKAYRLADQVIAVSSALAEQLRKLYAIDVSVVPNVVDTALFQKVSKDLRKTDGKIRFVSVGRLNSQKNMPMLVEVFGEAAKDNDNLHLTIIGDGLDKEKIMELIEKQKVGDKIELTGALSRTNITEIFAHSDCFILLSDYETFGVAYIEALSAGLPVISTDCGGPRDFMCSDFGLMIPTGNREAAIKAIQYMRIHYKDYDSKKISQAIAEKFSPDKIAESLKDIYCKVCLNEL